MQETREIIQLMDRIHLVRKILINNDTKQKTKLYFGQLPVLRFVIEHPGCTQKDLAGFIRVTPASIALSTKRLQKAGLLTKQTDENNLRCNRLFVTLKGKRVADSYKQAFTDLDERTFAGFTDEELSFLYTCLNRMLYNVGGDRYKDADFFALLSMTKESEQALKEENEEWKNGFHI